MVKSFFVVGERGGEETPSTDGVFAMGVRRGS